MLLRPCLFDPLSTAIQLRIPSGMVSGPLKFSRKYEPLTQGNGLNANHYGSSLDTREWSQPKPRREYRASVFISLDSMDHGAEPN